jgi:exoribonuclease R
VTRRGLTLYAPDTRVPLHPPVLGERAASRLPGQTARGCFRPSTSTATASCRRPTSAADGECLPLGAAVRVRLVEADPGRREVRFALA